jgi:hypothetical protein
VILLFRLKFALASSHLFKQRFVLSLKLSINRRTPLRTNFPPQPMRAAKRIPEASARLSMSPLVRNRSLGDDIGDKDHH